MSQLGRQPKLGAVDAHLGRYRLQTLALDWAGGT
jgi:hypothetical protein